MPKTILSRVIDSGMKRLKESIRDDIIGAAFLIIAIIRPFAMGKTNPGWEAFEDGIAVLGLMILCMTIRAIYEVWAEIKASATHITEAVSPVLLSDGTARRIYVREEPPKDFRAILTLIGSVVLMMTALGTYGVHTFVRNKLTEAQSTEPADRANLHVIGAEIDVRIPTEQDVATAEVQGSKLPDALAVSWLLRGTVPRAVVTMQNVGRNRALAPFMVRTAMIISSPLGPLEEDELFKNRPEWQIGGDLSIGNDWYPTDGPRDIHTRYNILMSDLRDWKELIHGTKVFYVVTRSIYCDRAGRLPEGFSCHWFSLDAKRNHGTCFTHNN
jgi:hypothetical protein